MTEGFVQKKTGWHPHRLFIQKGRLYTRERMEGGRVELNDLCLGSVLAERSGNHPVGRQECSAGTPF